ncbi:hypothetical protein HHK36_006906 [Tetracentron sinense]|uniref:Transmembrane protein n=1 Tax=Tetracentron sinense TaxID=13715 RepID=A0A834ZLR8_TETSI|nr:hypothetical protein HHK36_006906 [Tetracentron sinense]
MGLSSFFRSLVLVVFFTAIFTMQLGLVNSDPEVRKLGGNSKHRHSPPSPIRNKGPEYLPKRPPHRPSNPPQNSPSTPPPPPPAV